MFFFAPIPRGPCDRKNSIPIEISIPARKFQSRSKFSISIEKFNPRVSMYGALVVYRERLDRTFQSRIDRSKFSIPKATIEFFQSPGPLGINGGHAGTKKRPQLGPRTTQWFRHRVNGVGRVLYKAEPSQE